MTNAIKLDDISKWALATYNKTMGSTGSNHFNQMMPTSKSTQYMPKGKLKYTAAIDKYDRLSKKDTVARDFENELIAIKTIEELQIDHSQVMNLKKGDLSIIKGEVYRCYPIAPHLREIPLIVKRLECVDRKIYDLKIYESDTFMRFRGHPNIVSLYSYWAEQSHSKYVYKTLVQLYEEGVYGDMLRTVVLNAARPSIRLIQKFICDIAKGLVVIHNSNIVHGAVKPSNIYIGGSKVAMLGEFKKVELDSARQTHQLFSKLLIGKAIPKTLVYWAPELLKLESYDFRVDLWSLGVTIYQVVTGEHPFTVTDEEKFRDDILNGTVDWSRLESAPRIKTIVSNLLKVSPDQRWSAQQVLTHCQNDFAVDVQRTWRGFYQRKEFKRQCRALVKIQASVKGWLTRIHYQRDRIICRENAAIMIQKTFRSHARRKKFVRQRKALMVCQANVLCRQMKRAYQKSKLDVTNAQAYLRRYLAVTWFKRIKAKKAELEAHMETIGEEIAKYNIGAQIFKNHFTTKTISGPLKYLESFEEYEMTKAKTYGTEKSVIPRVSQIQNEINKLTEDKMLLVKKLEDQQKKNQSQDKDEEELKKILGDKFNDYKPMIEDVKKNLKRIAELSKKSNALDIKMQHEYKYSKWDQIHEPYNVVENVLKPDESVYRALNPSFDFTLHNGSSCFISEVIIHPGDVGPASVEIYVSNAADKWNFVRDFKCTRDNEQRFTLPGEQIAKYLRVKCVNNIRGGNIVSIKLIQIKGISKDV